MKAHRANGKARRRGGLVLALAVLVPLLAGCGLYNRRVGPVIRRTVSSRTETREVPVRNWPVWVFVNGTQVGAFRTDQVGEVPVNLGPHLAQASGGPLKVEFRFRQADGKVEQKFHTYSTGPPGGR